MFNDYFLLKRVQEEMGAVAYAQVQDSFTYTGEVAQSPYEINGLSGTVGFKKLPAKGDKVLFLKGAGEDITVGGEQMKAVKLEDIIMKID